MRGVPGSTAGHGTVARYVAGCRCDRCKDGRRRHQTRYRLAQDAGAQHTIPSTGTIRRLQALAALGWPSHEIAARLGCDRTSVEHLRRQARPVVLAITAAKIAGVYDELCMTPGPSPVSRRRALEKGWVPPLAWDDIDHDAAPNLGAARDDEVDAAAVERTLAGDRVPLNRPERVEVIRRLASRGLSDAEMGAVVGISSRSVCRIRAEFGIDTGWAAA